MEKILNFFRKSKKERDVPTKNPREEKEYLERKVVEGAQKAVEEYRGVFERLAKYDRT